MAGTAIVVPPTGGTSRPDGGKLAHIAGRPYRMNHAALRTNTEVILSDYFDEPYASPFTSVPSGLVPSAVVEMGAVLPNPFNPKTVIPLRLSAESHVNLTLFDARGHRVITLRDEILPVGPHEVHWDGHDSGGRAVASGTYFVRLRTPGGKETQAMTLVR